MMKPFTRIITLTLFLSLFVGGFSAQTEVIFSEDFESGALTWTISNGVWEIGVPTSGPGAAHSGRGLQRQYWLGIIRMILPVVS
jgi:hypothetical protein